TPEAKIILRDIEKLIGKQLSEMPLKNFDFEAADLSAAQRATAANGRRDPELARAASEYDKSQRRKAARKNGAPQEQSTRKRSANTAQPNRVNNNDNQTKKHNPAANPNAAKRPAASRNSSTTHSKSSYKKAPAGSSQDMRPGRAHRAAVASRSKKRTY
ncbi:MAG: hypothetical protein RR773_00325, partial [Raoultibacter sp.]